MSHEHDPQTAHSFEAYVQLLQPLNDRTPQHQGLLAEEYSEAMANPSVIKTEMNIDGETVRVPQLAPVEAFEWLNSGYYKEHFPEEQETGRLMHYSDFLTLRPGEEVKQKLLELGKQNGVLVFDHPESDPGYEERVQSVLTELGLGIEDAQVLGTQTYYAGPITFKREHEQREVPLSIHEAFHQLIAEGELDNEELINGTSAELVIEGEEADRMQEFFARAYEKISDHPCAQAFTPEEFKEMLTDERVTKIVYRKDGVAEAMCMLTTNLEDLSWINSDYYKQRFPDQYEKREVVWFPGIATNPDFRVAGRGLPKLVELLGRATEKADYKPVLVYDTPDANKGLLDSYIERENARRPYVDVNFQELDVQRYVAYRLVASQPS